MTEYKLNHFTIADARPLAGRAADITEWDDDELETKVTYPGARVIGIIDRIGPYLVIETAGAVVADAATGERLGTRPASAELRIAFTWICEVTGVRDPCRPGDRITLAETSDPAHQAPARRRGNRHPLRPRSTLPMLLNDADRVRLITPGNQGDREGARPVSASSPQPAALETAREPGQDLLGGIASADPAVTGPHEVPGLTPRRDYERGSLAAAHQLPDGDPAPGQAAEAFPGAARKEFRLEATRSARRRLASRAGGETEDEDGTEPEDGEAAPDWRQDISDPATGLSRLLSERCGTCILSPGDPMHLGSGRTAAFIRQVLAAGSYVICHQTLTYGDFPEYGPAICRGFFDSYRNRTRDLLILQAARRLTEVPPPLIAKAEQLGRDAGKAAASWVFDGSTPEEEYQRVLRGIADGDPAVLDPIEPCATGPGYGQDDLARDLGIEPGDCTLPPAASAYASAFTGAFWRETERAARDHLG